ncbi:uncharacterized protein LOC106734028 [Tupaia chinensis]|uniref:uncharacterized protein LOC106734028 n=1 Tax=Tupaia chinensis TaxID=246437 RepID=UPI00070454D9|nr:uncharacterized protein LOC106734028 [Tupaia chinensis]
MSSVHIAGAATDGSRNEVGQPGETRVRWATRDLEASSLPPPHDSLAPESRQPPEFRSPSPLPWNEIRGRAASGLRTPIPSLAGLRAQGENSLPWPAVPAPLSPAAAALAAASLVRTLPTCHREPPRCRACPVRGPSPPGFQRDVSPLLRVFAEAEGGGPGRPGGVRGGLFPDPAGPGPDGGLGPAYFQGMGNLAGDTFASAQVFKGPQKQGRSRGLVRDGKPLGAEPRS